MWGKIVTVLIFFVGLQSIFAQVQKPSGIRTIEWKATKFYSDPLSGKTKANFIFTGALFDRDNNFIPFISETKTAGLNSDYVPNFQALSFETVNEEERKYIEENWSKQIDQFVFKTTSGIASMQRIFVAEMIPFRKNSSGSYDKLTSYKVTWVSSGKFNPAQTSSINSYATSSVLASGDWYKVAITKNGVYKMDKSFLTSLGINLSNIDPRNIKVFGNGGQILSEKNSDAKYDDLIENAIMVTGEDDGVFDLTDEVVFYGKGPDQWKYNSNSTSDLKFSFVKNYYSDTAFYFITIGTTPGKRITDISSLDGQENYVSTTFDDFANHEIDAQNLIKSGREYYGEVFDLTTQYNFSFNFPNIVQGDTMFVKSTLVGRNQYTNSIFDLLLPDNSTLQFNCGSIGTNYTAPIGDEKTRFKRFVYSGGSVPSVTITKQTSSSTGWLDYVRLNARRSLVFADDILAFRDSRTFLAGRKTKFEIVSPSNLTVWDVTDHVDVKNQLTNFNSNQISFVSATDTLREFVAFGDNEIIVPIKCGKIANQNLHSITGDIDYIIITHPNFKSQALALAQLHQQYDTLSYVIATPQEIYNEFSSGVQDITALREFVRMIYKRSVKKPRYLLLFGDGSYNNLNTDVSSNTNFIPTYQGTNSIALTSSKVIDDFYGFLDDTEGNGIGIDMVDIGIGRLPVKTNDEATAMVEKVRHYYLQQGNITGEQNPCDNNVYNTFGDWRNWITLMSDDAEAGWEMEFVSGHNEDFATQIKNTDPTFNIDKIYLDAYQQNATAGGQKYPDAEADLNRRIQKGTLILNYSGHGGELQLTSEGVIDINIVNAWKNLNGLPMFVTATCEFSRFDDPSRTSCGELVLLNSQGGGICLFTTTRIAYSSDANALGPAFFNAALNQINGWYPRTGDIIRLTKQGSNRSYTHFCLLGDPAITLAYPKQRIYTTEINAKPVSVSGNDTLKALSSITIKGYVGDKNGTKLTNFNGIVFPTVFDKPSQQSTLGNDLGPSAMISFTVQKNILYKGKASVVNGDFEFNFIVPKDINYQFGKGKLSYYGHNGSIDAAGYYDNIYVGGSDPNPIIDNAGPQISLYMNDENFVVGGTTNESPKIFMKLLDSSGVNTVGSGIGHDVTAIIDGDNTNPLVLNDFYEADINNYKAGKIYYPLTNLDEGNHTLDVKVWDVQNNSSTASTEFIVAASAEMALKQVLNYPNPFTTNTKFFVEHNQCCVPLDLSIQIFTISGKLIKTINQDVQNQGFRIDGVDWDGKDDFGDKIGRGVYIYKVKIRSSTGISAEKIEKLVILN
jgi:hypothetical protein